METDLSQLPPASEFEWPEVIHCHELDMHLPGGGPTYAWDGPHGHCSYCGCAQPAAVYDFLRTTSPSRNPIYELSPAGITTVEQLAAWRADQEQRIRAWRGVDVADWKYGWPHKFYLTADDSTLFKWYNVHLEDLGGTEVFRPMTDLIHAHTGIRFLWYPDRVKTAGRKRKGQLGYIGGR